MNGKQHVSAGGSASALVRLKSPSRSPLVAAITFWLLIVALIYEDSLFPTTWIDTTWYRVFWKLCLNGAIASWVYLDAGGRGWDKERSQYYALFSMTLTEIVVPVYLVRSRGWKGAGLSILRFFVFLFVLILTLSLFEVLCRVLCV